MKSFSAIAIFGLAALVAAQDPNSSNTAVADPQPSNTDVPAADPQPSNTDVPDSQPTNTDAPTSDPEPTNTDGGDAAEPTNTDSNTATGGAAAPTGGLPPKTQACKSAYEQCQGSYTDAQKCSDAYATCQAACKSTQAQCVAAGNGGATCAANAAVCLGYDPYGAAPTDGAPVTVTQVVPSFVTYCPGATQFSTNGQTYTATGPGYVTVTNCPCTITSVVGSTPTGPAGNYGKGNGTSYNGPSYTGAANKVIGAGLSAVAAGAAFFAFAL